MASSAVDYYYPALVASSYSIDVRVLDDGGLFAFISAVDSQDTQLASRPHRSPKAMIRDLVHPADHVGAISYALRMDEHARDIRNLAKQSDVRVPDKKEAQAMARLRDQGKRIVGASRSPKSHFSTAS